MTNNEGLKLDRRTILAGISAGLAATGAGAALAQQATTPVAEKGPVVWLDMDQKQLDDAYDQSKYAPNLLQVVQRYTSNSNAMRARLGVLRAILDRGNEPEVRFGTLYIDASA